MIEFRQGQLYVEDCAASQLADRYGTPLYVYSATQLAKNCAAYADLRAPFSVSSHYAVKANGNLSLMRMIMQAGLGFDVVSGGELERCLYIGADPGKIVYSGVGKSEAELVQAIQAGIACINIESEEECARIIRLAAASEKTVKVAIRVNPDVAVDTHPYISTSLASTKFGLPSALVPAMAERLAAARYCELTGLGCHLGSMLEDISPIVAAGRQLVALAGNIAPRAAIRHLSLGGGLAVRYDSESEPTPQALLDACIPFVADRGLHVMLEPGRSIVANCGITLTRVERCKRGEQHNFAIVDAAMNDLPRPSLYNAWHAITPVRHTSARTCRWDVVGPVCESGDFIGKDRQLAISEKDLLAISTTGAYCASMASNYNSRPRAAEVLVEGKNSRLIAARQTFEQMLAPELAVEERLSPCGNR